eukprot:jgi/Bigna1/88496/estExt_fgenesh1_pg.C_330003
MEPLLQKEEEAEGIKSPGLTMKRACYPVEQMFQQREDKRLRQDQLNYGLHAASSAKQKGGVGGGGGAASSSRSFTFNRTEVVEALKRCNERPGATISQVLNKPVTWKSPVPLATVEMQKRASKYFNFKGKRTMEAAERLYQRGLISYPRTDTDVFSNEFDHTKILETLAVANKQDYRRDTSSMRNEYWKTYARSLLLASSRLGISSNYNHMNHSRSAPTNFQRQHHRPSSGNSTTQQIYFRRPREGNHDDKAHPPIHPTGFSAALVGDDATIYELVVRHYLACLSTDAKASSLEIILVHNSGERFHTRGLTVIEKGWLLVYRYERWGSAASNPTCAALRYYSKKIGCKLVPQEDVMVKIVEGSTTPPSLLTESELVDKMHSNGIGTDATIADHVQKVQDRCYTFLVSDGRRRRGNNGDTAASTSNCRRSRFHPSNLGVALIEGYKNMEAKGMFTPDLRRQMERDVQLISENKRKAEEVIEEALVQMEGVFNAVSSRSKVLDESVRKWCNGNQNKPGFHPYDLAPI